MELIKKNKKGKVTHILGLDAQIVSGVLLILAATLGVAWIYTKEIILFIAQLLE